METEQQIQDAADTHYTSRFSEIGRLVRLMDQANTLGHYEWQEEIRKRIEQLPLSLDLLAIYPPREVMEFQILLGTGGPADRVLVTTDFDGEVGSAIYQFQDWFTPWTDARNQDSDLVESFAATFFYSSVGDEVASFNARMI